METLEEQELPANKEVANMLIILEMCTRDSTEQFGKLQNLFKTCLAGSHYSITDAAQAASAKINCEHSQSLGMESRTMH